MRRNNFSSVRLVLLVSNVSPVKHVNRESRAKRVNPASNVKAEKHAVSVRRTNVKSARKHQPRNC